MQHPIGCVDQPYLLWEKNTQRHKYQEARIMEGCLGGWLSQKNFVCRKNDIIWFRYFKAIFLKIKIGYEILLIFQELCSLLFLYLFSNINVYVCRYNLQFWSIKWTKKILLMEKVEGDILNKKKLNDEYYLNTFKLKGPII